MFCCGTNMYPPWNLTLIPKTAIRERRYILQTIIFEFLIIFGIYVEFQECFVNDLVSSGPTGHQVWEGLRWEPSDRDWEFLAHFWRDTVVARRVFCRSLKLPQDPLNGQRPEMCFLVSEACFNWAFLAMSQVPPKTVLLHFRWELPWTANKAVHGVRTSKTTQWQ